MTKKGLKQRLHTIIFEAESTSGKIFDILLAVVIVASVLLVSLESVNYIRKFYGGWLLLAEYVITAFFTVEYILRIWIVNKPWRYIRSFYGIIDLISILPTYLSVFVPGLGAFLSIRTIRLLRIFRILKLAAYMDAANAIYVSLLASRRKIGVFIFTVLIVSMIFGTTMYVVEGDEHGFTDIPTSIYWTIVTMTTVGYGDISPGTPLGKFIATILMVMGFGIIAVPTGIVSAEMALRSTVRKKHTESCRNCLLESHDEDAIFCRRCGEKLN